MLVGPAGIVNVVAWVCSALPSSPSTASALSRGTLRVLLTARGGEPLVERRLRAAPLPVLVSVAGLDSVLPPPRRSACPLAAYAVSSRPRTTRAADRRTVVSRLMSGCIGISSGGGPERGRAQPTTVDAGAGEGVSASRDPP